MEVQEGNQPLIDIRKEEKNDKIDVKIQWETEAVSTECFGYFYNEKLVELAIYEKDNDLLEEEK